jgi:hypothetical protein
MSFYQVKLDGADCVGIGFEDWLLAVLGRGEPCRGSSCRIPTARQVKTTKASQGRRVMRSKSPRMTRGGVIARVQTSTRQKLKRPLRSTEDHH